MIRALGIAAILLASGASGAAGPVRLALVEGRDGAAPRAGLADLVVAALSADEGLELLDRAEASEAVLAQEIELGALLGDGAVAVGKLLAADLFVTLERFDGRHRMAIVETATGVVLGGWIETREDLETQVEAMVLRVRDALRKVRAPRDKRIYVGVLGFQSEEISSELDGRADALSLALASDLNLAPEMIVLDRDHLDRINEERDWTNFRARMKTSFSLVRGGIRKAENGGCQMTFFVERPGEKDPLAHRLALDGDFAKARGQLLRAVRHQFLVDPGGPFKFEPAREAALFAARAELLRSYGNLGGAVRALECAYAITPDQATRLELADMLWDHGSLLSGKVGDKKAPEDTHPQAIRRLVRSRQLQLKYWKTRLGQDEAGPVLREEIVTDYIYLTYRLPSEDPKLATMFAELKLMRDEVFAAEVECMRADGVAEPDLYYRPLKEYLYFQHAFGEDQRELAAAIRMLCDLADRGPDKALTEAYYLYLLGMMVKHLPNTFADAGSWTPVLELFEEWIASDGKTRRAVGAACKFHYLRKEKDRDSARAGAEAIEALLQYVEHDAIDEKTVWYQTFLSWSALPRGERDPKLLSRILEALLLQSSPAELAAWINASRSTWLGHMEKTLPEQQQKRWLDAARERLRPALHPGLPEAVRLNFESSLDYLDRKLGDTPEPPAANRWDSYQVSAARALPKPRGAEQLAVLERHGDRLLALWVSFHPERRHTLRVHAASYDLERHLKVDYGSVSYPLTKGNLALRPLDHLRPLVSDLEFDGERVFARVNHLGLAQFVEEKAEAVELPSDDISAFAALGDTLYIAFGEGAIFTFEPDGTLKELASSRSVAQRNPLDGGKPYRINCMLPDPERGRVWMNCPTTDRIGLWFHDRKKNRFERATPPLGNIGWHRASILRLSSAPHRWAFLRDPETGAIHSSFGAPREAGKPRPIDEIRSEPCGLIGDHLIVAGAPKGTGGSIVADGVRHFRKNKGGLFLFTGEGEPAWRATDPDEETPPVKFILNLSPERLLLADSEGDYRLLFRAENGAAGSEPPTR